MSRRRARGPQERARERAMARPGPLLVLATVGILLLVTAAATSRELSYGGSEAGAGCSSSYWTDHIGSWPNLLTIYTTLTQALGEFAYTLFGGPTTMLEALQNPANDPYSSLLREATASLLNSYARPGAFPYSPSGVRSAFQAAATSPRAAAEQAAKFRSANGQGLASCAG